MTETFFIMLIDQILSMWSSGLLSRERHVCVCTLLLFVFVLICCFSLSLFLLLFLDNDDEFLTDFQEYNILDV